MVNVNPGHPLGRVRLALGVRAPADEGDEVEYPRGLAGVWIAQGGTDTIVVAVTDAFAVDHRELEAAINDDTWRLRLIEVEHDRLEVERVVTAIHERLIRFEIPGEVGLARPGIAGPTIRLRTAEAIPADLLDGLPTDCVQLEVGPLASPL